MEVTNAEIEAYVLEHPDQRELFGVWRTLYNSRQPDFKPGDAARLPAASVTYYGAIRFARAMGGWLPTEAQWELAAKSGQDENVFPWGKEQPGRVNDRSRANVGNPTGAAFVGTFEKDVTADHVFDMAGNVREFCRDGYRPYSDLIAAGNTRENPLDEPCESLSTGGEGGEVSVVVRASSWNETVKKSKTFYRDPFKADDSSWDVGFRLVLECPLDSSADE